MFRENSLILHGKGRIIGVLRSALWNSAEEGVHPALHFRMTEERETFE